MISTSSNSYRKIIITIALFSLCFFTHPFQTPLVYAQEYEDLQETCTTCSELAPDLQTYRDFVSEVLQIFTDNYKASRGYSYNVYWPYQGWVWSIMTDREPVSIMRWVVMGTLQNYSRRQSHLKATLDIAWIYTQDIIRDWALYSIVMLQTRPIIRDFQYLLDIDEFIRNKIYDLGVSWKQGKKLSNEERAEFVRIIDKYSDINNNPDAIFRVGAEISSNISSTDVLHLLMRLNNKNKKILAITKTQLSKQEHIISFNRSASWRSTFVIKAEYFNKITKSYACARSSSHENSCWWSAFKKFSDSISNIADNFIEAWPQRARDKIRNAAQRLTIRGKKITGFEVDDKNILESYDVRERDLIQSWGDGRPVVKRSWWKILTQALSSNVRRVLSSDRRDAKATTKEFWKTLRNNMQGIFALHKDTSDDKLNDTQKKSLVEISSSSQIQIENNLQDLVLAHQHHRQKQLLVSTQDSQEAIAKITFRLRVINNFLEDYIKIDLTTVCNLQCSNLWWVCW